MSINIEFLNNLDSYIIEKSYRLVNSVLVYKDNELICEKYYNKCDENSCHPIQSIEKCILGLTLGICIYKGIVNSVDDPIGYYLPPFNEGRQPYHKLIKIHHLLTISSGIYWLKAANFTFPMSAQMRNMNPDEAISHLADIKMANLPGTTFIYRNLECDLLSYIILKSSNMTVEEFCYEYLYKPLEITNLSLNSLCARDLMKIGVLMLHGGEWNGRRIVSEEYIQASVSPSEVNKDRGYYWAIFDKWYQGQGAGGQELNIRPDDNAVAVVQATKSGDYRNSYTKSYPDICKHIFGY